MSTGQYVRIAPDVRLGEGVSIPGFVNLYGCTIGDNTKIGANTTIYSAAKIPAAYIAPGSTIR